MIPPAHRAAIEAQVEGASAYKYRDMMFEIIVETWNGLAGYPRAEVEAIVYKEEEQNDHAAARSKPA